MSLLEKSAYMPSPREIARQCAAIRRSWTPGERRRRAVGLRAMIGPVAWLPPRVITAQCMARVRSIVAETTA